MERLTDHIYVCRISKKWINIVGSNDQVLPVRLTMYQRYKLDRMNESQKAALYQTFKEAYVNLKHTFETKTGWLNWTVRHKTVKSEERKIKGCFI